jgi:hypothetical protein
MYIHRYIPATWNPTEGCHAHHTLCVLPSAVCCCCCCSLTDMCRLAKRSITQARSTMHQELGLSTLRLSPNCVVLDRLGLLEPAAMAYIDRMAIRVRGSVCGRDSVHFWARCCCVFCGWRLSLRSFATFVPSWPCESPGSFEAQLLGHDMSRDNHTIR